MKRIVIYDSEYGNTAKIAHVVAHTIEARILPISKAKPSDLDSTSVLVVGCPTWGGRPTPPMQKFLDSLPKHSLENTRVAAFDTRFSVKDQSFKLKLVMKTLGFAAPRIATALRYKGGYLACPPEGFIVDDRAGPLKKGEIERASDWAKSVVEVYTAA